MRESTPVRVVAETQELWLPSSQQVATVNVYFSPGIRFWISTSWPGTVRLPLSTSLLHVTRNWGLLSSSGAPQLRYTESAFTDLKIIGLGAGRSKKNNKSMNQIFTLFTSPFIIQYFYKRWLINKIWFYFITSSGWPLSNVLCMSFIFNLTLKTCWKDFCWTCGNGDFNSGPILVPGSYIFYINFKAESCHKTYLSE